MLTRSTESPDHGFLGAALVAAAIFWCAASSFAQGISTAASAADRGQTQVTVDANGTVHLPPTAVRYSEFASPESKVAFIRNATIASTLFARGRSDADRRRLANDYSRGAIDRTQVLYPTDSVPMSLAGVRANVITPKEGISPRNMNRVLISLHSGGFWGQMNSGEASPVASLGKIKVVAVDYRQGPENKFPAASEDVASVYKALLKTYPARNIGIYGCSAGAVLTAEATAWIKKEDLPTPGAIAMLCGSAAGWNGGDSGSLGIPLSGFTAPPNFSAAPHPQVYNAEYLSEADFSDPMVLPIRSSAVLAKFPPSLLVTSTRDPALSGVVYTHTQLVRLGVDAELHVWEGLEHGFVSDPDIPESREVWDVVVKFFDKHLGAD